VKNNRLEPVPVLKRNTRHRRRIADLKRITGILGACVLYFCGCSNPPGIKQSPEVKQPVGVNERPAGSITASPNPIRVCADALTGVTNLSWTSNGTTIVEVHVDSPAGPLLSRTGSSGSTTTGDWVVNGQVFYLQDVSHDEPLTPLTTIASVTVKHTQEGCPPD
jgi:hypothetical protein